MPSADDRVSRRPGPVTALVLTAALALWAAVSIPVALGERTFFLRDVLSVHLPFKAFGAEQLGEGRIPALNSTWALGQPFAGNPNALPFYPGNLLYLLLPFWSAFNLHYALHWLLALFTMRALARVLGMGREAALLAALTYAGGGWILTGLTFYNILAVSAWWPLAMTGAARGGRRGIALGGVAGGLAILAGDPVTAALGLVPLLMVATERHGWRKGLLTATALAAVAVAVALPQIVASLRTLSFTVRGGSGLPAYRPSIYAFHPLRLAELVIPFPLGWPGELGHRAFWKSEAFPREPFVYTIHFGLVGLWLAWRGRRSRQPWIWLAVAGLACATLGRVSPGLFRELGAGLFRYAEKFLFWFALATPLLAGAGLDQLLKKPPARLRGLWTGAGTLLALAGLLLLVRPAFLDSVRAGVRADPADAARTMASTEFHLLLWLGGLALGGLLLAAAAPAVRRRRAALILGLQLAGLVQLFPIVRTTRLAPLRESSSWLRFLEEDASLSRWTAPRGPQPPGYSLAEETQAEVARLRALDLDLPFGVLRGLSYPLAPDVEGIYSPLYTDLPRALESADWPARVNWLRALGVEYALLAEETHPEGLARIATADRFGVATTLYRVVGPAPRAWWPARVRIERDPQAAFRAVGTASDPVAEVVVPRTLAHTPGGRVHLVDSGPDRLVVDATSSGGVLVLRRAFQELLVARSGSERLQTLPINLGLLGVVVPPGSHRVTVAVDRRPEVLAGILALAVFGGALWILRPGRTSRRRRDS